MNRLQLCQCRMRAMSGGVATMRLMESITPTMSVEEFESALIGVQLATSGDVCGRTPLHRLVECDNDVLVDHVLKEYGTFLVNLGDEAGVTPLHVAIGIADERRALAMVQRLCAAGAEVNIAGHSLTRIDTPLLRAQRRGGRKLLMELLYRGAVDPTPPISGMKRGREPALWAVNDSVRVALDEATCARVGRLLLSEIQ